MTETPNTEDEFENVEIEESPDLDPAEAELDWDNETLGSMEQYATRDNEIELEEEDEV